MKQALSTKQVLARAAETPDWVWQPLIAPTGLTILFADSGAGKSTLMTSWINANLSDAPEFLGLPSRPAVILYFTEEGDKGIRRRVLTPPDSACIESDRLGWLPIGEPVQMNYRDKDGNDRGRVETMLKGGLEQIKELIEEEAAAHRAGPYKHLPFVVIIDTLTVFVQTNDDNQGNAVASALVELRCLAKRLGIAIVGLHHVNREGERNKQRMSYAGSIQWRAQSDIFAGMLAGNGNRRVLKVWKNRLDDDQNMKLPLGFDFERGYYLLEDEEAERALDEVSRAEQRVIEKAIREAIIELHDDGQNGHDIAEALEAMFPDAKTPKKTKIYEIIKEEEARRERMEKVA